MRMRRRHAGNANATSPCQAQHVLVLILLVIAVALIDSINPSTVGPALIYALGSRARRDLALFTAMSDASDQVGWAGSGHPTVVVVAAGLVAVPLLSLRRTAPGPACLAVAAHAAVVTAVLGSRPLVSLLVVLYAAAVWGGRRWALGALAAVLGAHVLALSYEASLGSRGAALVAVAVVYLLLDLATWSAGRWGAGAAARSRAAQLEMSRAGLAAEAVAAERLRIARELHDIVAHAVTVMVLQSAGARRSAGTDPRAAALALESVEEVGRQAMAELRRLLEVLRAGADDGGRAPPGGAGGHVGDGGAGTLAGLPTLTDRATASGIKVHTRTRGAAGSLDPSVELAAYRTVQEGLTNVAKHGDVEARVDLDLRWSAEQLRITVTNAPSGRARPVVHEPSGYGLVGLSERVTIVGGTLEAAPTPAGGFRLRVTLPTADARRPAPVEA